jgi:DNA-binding NarL/FixJ family response regulator
MTRSRKARTGVVVADPHFLSRAGLCVAIRELRDFHLIREVESREELVEALKLKPGIVAIDLFAGPFIGLDPAEFGGTPKVVIVSSNNTHENVSAAVGHNVSSYLTKVCDKLEIQQAFVAVAKGERFFCNQILEIILKQHSASPVENCKPSKLSDREIQIVRLVAEGLTTVAIARQLHLSPHTVYTHRKNIMRKVNVNSAPELVLYAVTEGLIATG